MRGDLPACGAGAGIFSGCTGGTDRTQEEAGIPAAFGGEVQATHFCQGGNSRTGYHDQSALGAAEDVFGHGHDAGFMAFNADQVSERDSGLIQSPGMKLRGNRPQPENGPAAVGEQRQKQGEAGSDLERIG